MKKSRRKVPAIQAKGLRHQSSQLFKPASPITLVEFFSGRIAQLDKTYEAIFQEGQHVVLYGERGVGKTSLANIIGPYAVASGGGKLIVGKINCDGTDSFASVWCKLLDTLSWVKEATGAGFIEQTTYERDSLKSQLPKDAAPNDVRLLLGSLPTPVVIVFDEFDRLPKAVAKQFTDLIKSLSDYAVPSTIIMVGVADTVEKLIEDHGSIDRALVQILMPRMSDAELEQILTTAAQKLSMTFSSDALSKIVKLSQGLPHYTHLVGLASVKDCLDDGFRDVDENNVGAGLKAAVDNAQHSIKTAHHKATISAHKDALFEEVLTACALARKDQLSYFQAADVAPKMSEIMGRQYEIPAFARHLKEFCSIARGTVLEKSGEKRGIRYRFTNPLMEPYVIMLAMAEKII